MAMQASKIVAYRELAEQVYGQKITANSSVSDWMLTDDNVKASVSGVIRGARVVKSYPAGEHYVTELELDFSQVWALYQQQSRPQRVKGSDVFLALLNVCSTACIEPRIYAAFLLYKTLISNQSLEKGMLSGSDALVRPLNHCLNLR